MDEKILIELLKALSTVLEETNTPQEEENKSNLGDFDLSKLTFNKLNKHEMNLANIVLADKKLPEYIVDAYDIFEQLNEAIMVIKKVTNHDIDCKKIIECFLDDIAKLMELDFKLSLTER